MGKRSFRNRHDSQTNSDWIKVTLRLHSLLVGEVSSWDVHLGGSVLHLVTDDAVVVISLFVEPDVDLEVILLLIVHG